MLKEHATFFRQLMILTDLSLVMIAYFFGYVIRFGTQWEELTETYLWVLPMVMVTWWALLYCFGIYHSLRTKRISEIAGIIGKSAFFGFLVYGAVTYTLNVQHISRKFIALVFVIAAVFIAIEKILILLFFRHLRKKGFNFRNVLIVGTGRRAQKFIQEVNIHREFGLNIIGLLDHDPGNAGRSVLGHQVLGTFQDIGRVLRDMAVDHVVFIVPRSVLNAIEPMILHCEMLGTRISVAVDLFDLQFTMGKEGSLLGIPMITFENTPSKIGSLVFKRIIDIIAAFTGLIVLSPVLLLTALAIRLTSDGPVLFRQERTSLYGRRFKLLKFRTMVKDAEARLEELRQQNEMKGPVFKMKHDPRLTKIGRFLRKASIDELPQLWNVLRGDMSLVGPRPPIPREVAAYDHWQRRRLSMRPGITCLWQAYGRNEITDFDEWMKLDLHYIDNWSLWLDLKILFRTIPVVLFGHGAK